MTDVLALIFSLSIIAYLIGAAVIGVHVWYAVHDMKSSTRRAAHVAGWSAGVLWPVGAPIVVPWALYKNGTWLAHGVRELYRTFVPAKTKLPEARVVR